MTLEEIEQMVDTLPERIIRFCSKAPRTWDEIVGSMAGVSNPARESISVDDAQRVHVATQVLWEMVSDGRMVREVATIDPHPRYDTYTPR